MLMFKLYELLLLFDATHLFRCGEYSLLYNMCTCKISTVVELTAIKTQSRPGQT